MEQDAEDEVKSIADPGTHKAYPTDCQAKTGFLDGWSLFTQRLLKVSSWLPRSKTSTPEKVSYLAHILYLCPKQYQTTVLWMINRTPRTKIPHMETLNL